MIRRVRTLAGVKFYNAPIGTPIVAGRVLKKNIRVRKQQSDIGGNSVQLIQERLNAVDKNVLPGTQKHVKWQAVGFLPDEPHGTPVMAYMVEGHEFPTLYSELQFSDEVVQGVLDDLQTAQDNLPEDLRDVTLGVYIPADDPLFTDDGGNPDPSTGGYTVAGSTLINLNPMVAQQYPMSPEEGWDWEYHPPAFNYMAPRLSTIMHESGHVVSGQRGTLRPEEESSVVSMISRQGQTKGYSTTAPQEAYAEFYMQYKMGGRGSSQQADAWADEFDWY